MRGTTGSAAPTAARCRKFRRGSFILIPPSMVSLFNHLIGASKERGWYREAERLGSDQVDDQVEFDRLLDRQVRGLCAAQNLVDIVAGAPEQVRDVCPVGDQTSRVDLLASTMHRRQSCAQRQSVDPKAVAG